MIMTYLSNMSLESSKFHLFQIEEDDLNEPAQKRMKTEGTYFYFIKEYNL